MKRIFIGILFSICITSIAQDLIGKEAWIAHISATWMSAWITVPLAIFGILLCFVAMLVCLHQDSRTKLADKVWDMIQSNPKLKRTVLASLQVHEAEKLIDEMVAEEAKYRFGRLEAKRKLLAEEIAAAKGEAKEPAKEPESQFKVTGDQPRV